MEYRIPLNSRFFADNDPDLQEKLGVGRIRVNIFHKLSLINYCSPSSKSVHEVDGPSSNIRPLVHLKLIMLVQQPNSSVRWTIGTKILVCCPHGRLGSRRPDCLSGAVDLARLWLSRAGQGKSGHRPKFMDRWTHLYS